MSRIAINGLRRMGRLFVRAAIDRGHDVNRMVGFSGCILKPLR